MSIPLIYWLPVATCALLIVRAMQWRGAKAEKWEQWLRAHSMKVKGSIRP